MATRTQTYHQAAVAYLVYGLIYLAGAVYVAEAGLSARSPRPGSGLVWFLIGALFVVVFPVLIWKGYKWFTRILALLVLVRVIGLVRVLFENSGMRVPLPGGAEMPMGYGVLAFLLLTTATGLMLARAGWGRDG